MDVDNRLAPLRDPRTGRADETVRLPSALEIERTARRLRAAQPAWAALPPDGRAEALMRLHGAIGRLEGPIAAALERDTGRRRIARMEVSAALGSVARWASDAPGLLPAGWIQGRSMPTVRHAPQWVPYRLAVVVSPWNFPLLLTMIDAVPALLAGCAVLAKPSDVTPRFAAPLNQAVADAGLSDLFAILPGDGAAGEAAVDAADVVCFTGSVATGRKVAIRAAGRLIPACLELGGKDPLVVLASADVEAAARAALRASVQSTGQACQSIERIYVHRSLHGPFLDRLTAGAEAARLSFPDAGAGEIGPIIFAPQAEVLRGQIADALAKGARLLTGGTVETLGGGLWLRPTVLADVTHEMAVMREETFGPVMPVMAFDTDEEAVSLANDGFYGLSAAVFAGTLDDAEAFARRIDAGAVSLNDAALTSVFNEAPKQSFGASGLGPSRMGPDGFARFLRRKALIAQTGAVRDLAAYAEDAP